MINRDNLREELSKLREEQSVLSSRIKKLNNVLSSTTDELAELYLRDDIYLSTKTIIKGIVHVLFDREGNVYLVEGRNAYVGPFNLKCKISYEDYVKLEKH